MDLKGSDWFILENNLKIRNILLFLHFNPLLKNASLESPVQYAISSRLRVDFYSYDTFKLQRYVKQNVTVPLNVLTMLQKKFSHYETWMNVALRFSDEMLKEIMASFNLGEFWKHEA